MPAHHHHGIAPGLAAPELAHHDHDGLAPLGAAGAPPAGLRPPKRDDGQTVASGWPPRDQTESEGLDYAGQQAKLRALLAAEFALAGWTFTDLKSGGYLVGKWGRTRHVMDLAGAEAFLEEIRGVRS